MRRPIRFIAALALLALLAAQAPARGQGRGEGVAATRAAARRGDPRAAFRLALMYLDGAGVPRNPVEAARSMKMAAERGHVRAQYYLGTFYYEGTGVKRDRKAASRWIGMAAAAGDDEAQYAYGMLLLSGDGVAVDKVQAMEWLGKASRQGNEGARDVLQELVAFQGRPPEIRSLKPELAPAPPVLRSRGDGPRFEGKGVVLNQGEFSLKFSMPDAKEADAPATTPARGTGILDRLQDYQGGKFEIIYRPGRKGP